MTAEDWLNGEQLSIDIWKNKYRNGDESFEDWLKRVSGGNEKVANLIREKKFIFAGRILSNRGVKDTNTSLSNCYVLPAPEDNLEAIFHTASEMARTFSYGGGVGIDVSKLRPKGAKVHNAAKTTSGTASFMDFYSYVTGLIGQSGRRGALMLSISCDHPDLLEFINLKSDLDLCTKANISVRVNDAFMEAAEKGEDFTLRFKMEDGTEITKVINAKETFRLLAKRNWEMAEPGILFWDKISNYNLLQDTGFKYAGVNPCAEEPLPAYGACLLGSINLSEFVQKPFTPEASIDFETLVYTVKTAVYALNNVLDEGIERHPLKWQKTTAHDLRQIGLGTLGLGDMLIKLGIKYGASDKAKKVIKKVYKSIAQNAVLASLELAKKHGPFSATTEATNSKIAQPDFIRNLEFDKQLYTANIADEIKRYGLRNSQILTCAPTGTIGTMLQVSTGVEPNFAFSYNRRTVSLNDKETVYKVDARIAKEFKEVTGQDTLPDYFVTAQEIPYPERIKVQSILQKYIDASISSTVNLPNSATVDDVADLYMQAWKSGLKGITIWRDGCQRQAILSTDKKAENEEKTEVKISQPVIKKVSDDCIGRKRTLTTGCGSLHVTSFYDRTTGKLLETYFSKGSTGGCQNFMVGLSRMVSLCARAGVPIEAIADQLHSCGTCPSYAVRTATKRDTSKGSCCPVAIGYALVDMHKEVQKDLNLDNNKQDETTPEAPTSPKCPKCGEPVVMTEGCMTCPSCGYSKCS